MGYMSEVREKLGKYMGVEKADAILLGCLKKLGFGLNDLDKVQEPQVILQVGACLVSHSGMAEMVGRTVRVYALNRGAKLDEGQSQQIMASLRT